jgi:hypothetical protein
MEWVKHRPLNAREELEQNAKDLWEEAFAADPHHVEEVTAKILGDKCVNGVFVAANCTDEQLHHLRRAVYITVLEARG